MVREVRNYEFRTFDERRKFAFYRLPRDIRERVIEKLVSVLRKRDEVLLAIVYGGFIDSEVFRDIDLAIYTMYSVPIDEEYGYEYMLSEELTREINIPVDVILLDYTPIDLKKRILSNGRVIYERYGWIKTKQTIQY